tara:strand:- start:64 stop:207 length:144 start_codon:yes stop_codon:yes gene_type:complete
MTIISKFFALCKPKGLALFLAECSYMPLQFWASLYHKIIALSIASKD